LFYTSTLSIGSKQTLLAPYNYTLFQKEFSPESNISQQSQEAWAQAFSLSSRAFYAISLPRLAAPVPHSIGKTRANFSR